MDTHAYPPQHLSQTPDVLTMKCKMKQMQHNRVYALSPPALETAVQQANRLCVLAIDNCRRRRWTRKATLINASADALETKRRYRTSRPPISVPTTTCGGRDGVDRVPTLWGGWPQMQVGLTRAGGMADDVQIVSGSTSNVCGTVLFLDAVSRNSTALMIMLLV
jgi:hypothetical protein